MSALSDHIEEFIISLLSDEGEAELQRNKLANEFGCAPSQINYVLTTRFTVQRGYAVQSRRGGGGYIRILRIPDDCDELLHQAAELETTLSKAEAADQIRRLEECGAIDKPQSVLMQAAVSDAALGGLEAQQRNSLRAHIFQSMALALAMLEEDE